MADVPSYLECPICKEVLSEPVVCSDELTYCRECATKAIAAQRQLDQYAQIKSPCCGDIGKDFMVMWVDRRTREAVEAWKSAPRRVSPDMSGLGETLVAALSGFFSGKSRTSRQPGPVPMEGVQPQVQRPQPHYATHTRHPSAGGMQSPTGGVAMELMDDADDADEIGEIFATVPCVELIHNQEFVRITMPSAPSSMPGMDVVIALDMSGSMARNVVIPGQTVESSFSRAALAKHAVSAVLATLRPCDTVTLLIFNTNVDVVGSARGGNVQVLMDKLSDVMPNCCTASGLAVSRMLEHIKALPSAVDSSLCPRPQAGGGHRKKALLFFTDGCHNQGKAPQDVLARELRSDIARHGSMSSYICYTFAFGYDSSMDCVGLRDMAESLNGAFCYIPSADLLATCMGHAIAAIHTTAATNVVFRVGDEVVYKAGAVRYGQPLILPRAFTYEGRPIELLGIESQSASQTRVTGWIGGKRFDLSLATSPECMSPADVEFYTYCRVLAEYLPCNAFPPEVQICSDTAHEAMRTLFTGELTLSLEHINVWGRPFQVSTASMLNTQCKASNRDPLPFNGASVLFQQVVDRASDAFDDLPNPETEEQRTMRVSKGVSRSQTHMMPEEYKQAAAQQTAGATFNSSSSTCVGGGCMVLMADGTRKRAAVVDVGEKVWVDRGEPDDSGMLRWCVAAVTHIVETRPTSKVSLVEFPGGLIVTPNHPVKFSGKFVHPINCGHGLVFETPRLFSFAVDTQGACMDINDLRVVTLAHGIRGDPVAEHDFYGTSRVLDALGCGPGRYVFKGNCSCVRDSKTGDIVGFNPSTLSVFKH